MLLSNWLKNILLHDLPKNISHLFLVSAKGSQCLCYGSEEPRFIFHRSYKISALWPNYYRWTISRYDKKIVDILGGEKMERVKVTRKELHDVIANGRGNSLSSKHKLALQYVIEKLYLRQDVKTKKTLKDIMDKYFFNRYFQKWDKCKRTSDRFEKKCRCWLEKDIPFPADMHKYILEAPCSGSSGLSGKGRPKKDFERSSDRTKRRKVIDLREKASAAELSLATSMTLRSQGNDAAAKRITEMTTTTPTRRKMLEKWRSIPTPQNELTPEEALSLIVDYNLTKFQYQIIRQTAKKCGHQLYPSYERVREQKNSSYPQVISVGEIKCEVDLQELLNHTASRIIASMPTFSDDRGVVNLSLVCKWGFDGSSGYSPYKQIWGDPHVSDDSLFATSVVPLRLMDDVTGEAVWSNPRPSSTRFCRPIRLQWVRETAEVAKEEERYVSKLIRRLQILKIGSITVRYSMHLTMIDGKVCSALSKTSTLKYYVCGAKISEMNELKRMKDRQVEESKYSFGLSPLHCYIRFFECLLRVSYRLSVKKWRTKATELEWRKKEIQDSFKRKMGLLIDIPKPGHGTTNDGNTARRFFSDPKLTSEITGINEELISRFASILKALSSGLEIDYGNFSEYCSETASLFVDLYLWYYMPPTVHKVLFHGASIAMAAVLPIGQLSEEALESRHKDIRRYRAHHTRKISRLVEMEDFFRRLLLTSDPLISNSFVCKNVKRNISKEIRNLLVLEEPTSDEDSDDWEADEN